MAVEAMTVQISAKGHGADLLIKRLLCFEMVVPALASRWHLQGIDRVEKSWNRRRQARPAAIAAWSSSDVVVGLKNT